MSNAVLSILYEVFFFLLVQSKSISFSPINLNGISVHSTYKKKTICASIIFWTKRLNRILHKPLLSWHCRNSILITTTTWKEHMKWKWKTMIQSESKWIRASAWQNEHIFKLKWNFLAMQCTERTTECVCCRAEWVSQRQIMIETESLKYFVE